MTDKETKLRTDFATDVIMLESDLSNIDNTIPLPGVRPNIDNPVSSPDMRYALNQASLVAAATGGDAYQINAWLASKGISSANLIPANRYNYTVNTTSNINITITGLRDFVAQELDNGVELNKYIIVFVEFVDMNSADYNKAVQAQDMYLKYSSKFASEGSYTDNVISSATAINTILYYGNKYYYPILYSVVQDEVLNSRYTLDIDGENKSGYTQTVGSTLSYITQQPEPAVASPTVKFATNQSALVELAISGSNTALNTALQAAVGVTPSQLIPANRYVYQTVSDTSLSVSLKGLEDYVQANIDEVANLNKTALYFLELVGLTQAQHTLYTSGGGSLSLSRKQSGDWIDVSINPALIGSNIFALDGKYYIPAKMSFDSSVQTQVPISYTIKGTTDIDSSGSAFTTTVGPNLALGVQRILPIASPEIIIAANQLSLINLAVSGTNADLETLLSTFKSCTHEHLIPDSKYSISSNTDTQLTTTLTNLTGNAIESGDTYPKQSLAINFYECVGMTDAMFQVLQAGNGLLRISVRNSTGDWDVETYLPAQAAARLIKIEGKYYIPDTFQIVPENYNPLNVVIDPTSRIVKFDFDLDGSNIDYSPNASEVLTSNYTVVAETGISCAGATNSVTLTSLNASGQMFVNFLTDEDGIFVGGSSPSKDVVTEVSQNEDGSYTYVVGNVGSTNARIALLPTGSSVKANTVAVSGNPTAFIEDGFWKVCLASGYVAAQPPKVDNVYIPYVIGSGPINTMMNVTGTSDNPLSYELDGSYLFTLNNATKEVVFAGYDEQDYIAVTTQVNVSNGTKTGSGYILAETVRKIIIDTDAVTSLSIAWDTFSVSGKIIGRLSFTEVKLRITDNVGNTYTAPNLGIVNPDGGFFFGTVDALKGLYVTPNKPIPDNCTWTIEVYIPNTDVVGSLTLSPAFSMLQIINAEDFEYDSRGMIYTDRTVRDLHNVRVRGYALTFSPGDTVKLYLNVSNSAISMNSTTTVDAVVDSQGYIDTTIDFVAAFPDELDVTIGDSNEDTGSYFTPDIRYIRVAVADTSSSTTRAWFSPYYTLTKVQKEMAMATLGAVTFYYPAFEPNGGLSFRFGTHSMEGSYKFKVVDENNAESPVYEITNIKPTDKFIQKSGIAYSEMPPGRRLSIKTVEAKSFSGTSPSRIPDATDADYYFGFIDATLNFGVVNTGTTHFLFMQSAKSYWTNSDNFAPYFPFNDNAIISNDGKISDARYGSGALISSRSEFTSLIDMKISSASDLDSNALFTEGDVSMKLAYSAQYWGDMTNGDGYTLERFISGLAVKSVSRKFGTI